MAVCCGTPVGLVDALVGVVRLGWVLGAESSDAQAPRPTNAATATDATMAALP